MSDNERDWRINEREYTRITDDELIAILDDTGADNPANDSYTPDRVYAMARGLRDARRLIEAITAPGSPAPAEAKAKLYRELSKRDPDSKPEGTLESLERSMKMIDTYASDALPAEPNGQIHFARAMLESVADEIRAYLAATPGA